MASLKDEMTAARQRGVNGSIFL